MAIERYEASSPGGAPKVVTELDGVRGIAILLVLIYHFGAYTTEDASRADRAYQAIIGLGWTGVDLFFVLSGFLITGILLDAKGSPHYFRRFYMRRVLRILPLYYVTLLAYFYLVLPVAGKVLPDASSVARVQSISTVWEQLWYWLHLSNWRIGFDVHFRGLEHLWSLAVEEQFYLLWPVIVLVCSESVLLRICCGCMLAAVVLRNLPGFLEMQSTYQYFFYCLTPFRTDALACGACVALLARRRCVQPSPPLLATASLLVGAIAVMAAVLHGSSVSSISPSMARFGFTGLALIGASMVLYATIHTGSSDPFTRMLRHPVLVSFGKYSYGIYVLHPALSIFAPGVVAQLGEYVGLPLSSVIVITVGSAVSYGLALCSWHVLEKHFLRLKQRFPYQLATRAASA